MKIEYRFLQILIVPLGIAAILIGAMIISLGELPTLHFFESSYAFMLRQAVILEPETVSTTIDNEFRFYAVLWFCYGLWGLRIARKIESEISLIPAFFGIFFLGGIARALSVFSVGEPHPLFILLMFIEFLIPILAGVFYFRLRRGLT